MKSEKILKLLYDKKFTEIETACIEEIRQESVKTKGLTMDKGLTKLMKLVKKECSYLYKAYEYSDNKYMFTDGRRVYLLNDNYGYEICKKSDESYMNTCSEMMEKYLSETETVTIKIDLSDLETYVKVEKAKKNQRPVYKVSDCNNTVLRCFNAIWLLDALKTFKTDKIAVIKDKTMYPCIIYKEDEVAVILPIRSEDTK